MFSNMRTMAKPLPVDPTLQKPEVVEFPTGLRFEITGPQGCGKTLAAAWVRANLPADLTGAPDANSAPPTFDEWFKAKNYGASFDALHFQAGATWDSTFRALAREMRDYTTEMVRRITEDMKNG